MTVLIVGAKPNPNIPDCAMSETTFINGAIYWSSQMPDPGFRRHYMTTYLLTDYPERDHYASRRRAVFGQRSDECLLVDTAPKDRHAFNFPDLNYQSKSVKRISMRERWGWVKQVLTIDHLRVIRDQMASYVGVGADGIDVTGDIEHRLMRPSSGVFSLIFLLTEFERYDQIVLAGIGLERAHNHFYHTQSDEPRPHLFIDGLYLSVLNELYQDRVKLMSTESSVMQLTDIRPWPGRVIHAKNLT